MTMTLTVGLRVRIDATASPHRLRYPYRTGTIIRVRKDALVAVRWDGTMTPKLIHKTFLLAARPEQEDV